MKAMRPPRAYERLTAILLGRTPSADFILGDLREDYCAIRRDRSRLSANLWYLIESLRIATRVRIANSPARGRNGDTSMRTELRQAVRFMKRRPAFSAAVMLTVALAIAATTLAFAVVDGVLLEPLAYGQQDRLAVVWEHAIARGNDRNVASPANYLTWRDELRSFEQLAAVVESSTTLTIDGEPERVGTMDASATYFDVVGARPLVGRLYDARDDEPGAAAVAVISESYWRRRWGADPAVIGRSVMVGTAPAEIVGVLPALYDYAPSRASFGSIGTRDVWIPQRYSPEARQASGRFLEVIGRLAPGATIESARVEASALAERLTTEIPNRQTNWGINVVGLRADLVGDARTPILIVFGAVCFVLLIACANVANLLMTRAAERQQEIAVRAALGAGRVRLIRQLLTESVLLSMAGGAMGILLAAWGLESLVALSPDLPRLEAIGMDASVIGFALIATLVTAILFGLAPALHIAGSDVAAWLKDRTGAGHRSAKRMRGALVVAQVSLSFVLLIGAGLLARSLVNRMDLGVGFDVERLLVADLPVPSSRYETREAQAMFVDQLAQRVRAIPGVLASSAITWVPLAGAGSATSIWPMDQPVPEAGQHPVADIRWVHRDYHATMGIALVAGRYFDDTDISNAPVSVLVNETGARSLWPGGNVIGRQIAMPWGDTVRATVVGVVADVRHNGPETEQRAMLYYDQRQHFPFNNVTLVVRTQGEPGAIVPQVRAAVRELDATLPLYNVRSMRELFADALARARFTALSLGLFALLALVLAAIGIYGVIAYATEQRAREFGIRMALGADRAAVMRLVVSQGIPVIGIALGLGALGALALGRLLRNLVFGVSTTDPITFVLMAALLAVTGIAACWLPARRASGISPVDAIRNE